MQQIDGRWGIVFDRVSGVSFAEQVILAANGNRPIILPISGRRSSSIIAGTHSMGAVFGANMSSGAPAAMSFTSRQRPA